MRIYYFFHYILLYNNVDTTSGLYKGGIVVKKKLISIFLVLLMTAAALVPMFAVAEDAGADAAGYYFVYTQNGKGLNVRNTPGGQTVGSLKYGSKVYCHYFDDGKGWAQIDFTYNKPNYGRGKYICYVQNKYLQRAKPPERGKAAEAKKDTKKEVITDPFEAINAEYKSAKKVTPYIVVIKPLKANKKVSLLWAPHLKAEPVTTYSAGDELTVVQETENWLMIEDPDTGDIGFIQKELTGPAVIEEEE